MRRLEGDNAANLQFLNLCVGSPWNARARSTQQTPTIQQKDELESGRRAKRVYLRQNILEKYGRTAGCPGCLGIGQRTEECRAGIEQEMVDKGDATKLETSGNQEEIVPDRDVNNKERTIGEPDINPGGASSLTADTESEQGTSAENESSLAGCIAAVNELLCDMPPVDLSPDRTALSGKFPENELKAGRELELRNMLNFDAFELVDELPPEKHVYDMVWLDEWRGDRVRSRLCVRQFEAEGLREDLFAGTPDTFFIKYLLAKAASCKNLGLLVVDISVAFMHARADEEIYVKVPSGIKSSRFWRLKAAVNGTRRASKLLQEFLCDKLVANMLCQQNDINPCIYRRFSDNWDLEQHGDDFLVCGLTSNLEVLADEFKNHFSGKEGCSCEPEA